MKSILGIITALGLIAMFLAQPSCKTFGPVVEGGKHCALEAGEDTLKEVLPRVNAVLGCSIADPAAIPVCVGAGLAQLAAEFGREFVLCAAEKIASAKFAMPGDPPAAVTIKQNRAAAYLESQK